MSHCNARPNAIGGRVWISAALLCACGSTDVIADVARGDGGAATSGDGASMESASLAAWCRGEAALRTVTADGRAALECATRLAARSFGHAVCACDTITGQGVLSTSGFEVGGSQSRAAGAAVGINAASGEAATLPALFVGGSVTLAGQAPVMLAAASQTVAGDLRSRASLWPSSAQTQLRVERDAWLPASSALDPARLSVGGDLHLAPAAADAQQADRWSTAAVAGETRRADLTLAPPCPCDDHQRLDVAAMVAWAETHNDNAQLPFAASALSSPAGPTTRELPCGRYHFPAIDGPGRLTLRIDQPVALFVGDLLSWIEIELGPAGSLDLFVAGTFEPRGGRLGSRDRPAATRVYVHDQPAADPVEMIGELVSNFYGPNVRAQTFNALRHGSMLVRELLVPDTLTVNYDRSIADPGVCGARAGEACRGCGECADGQACLSGRCTSCRSDADCCTPLVCGNGRCEALLL